MVEAMQSCSSRAGMTTERSDNGGQMGVVMSRTTPTNQDASRHDWRFHQGYSPTMFALANSIPLPLACNRARSMEHRMAVALDRRQPAIGQSGVRTTRSIVPATSRSLCPHPDLRLALSLMVLQAVGAGSASDRVGESNHAPETRAHQIRRSTVDDSATKHLSSS